MKLLLFVAVTSCLLGSIVCPPVKPHPKEGPPRNEEMSLGLQYEKYLKEVVNVLEEDASFKKKLEESNITEIKSGDIAKHLDFVSHNVRSKLDELKRKEVDRLNQLKKLMEHQRKLNEPGFKPKMPGIGRAIPDISGKVVDAMLKAQGIDPNAAVDHDHHVDINNPETFEVDDLRKLIVKATKDLESIDKVRKGEFKKHEMDKEHLRREKLKMMNERDRKEEEAKMAEMKKKHKEHPKVHHPGNKAQLEEVWEEKDGMKKEDFNPKTFFFLHDTNGDGFLDEEELEALFITELDKVYDPKNAEDDMEERYEEMNRMREHVQDEVDADDDGLVSLQEFMDSTHKEAFDKDPEWKTVDEDEEWTEEELKEYEEELRRQNELHGQANEGHAQAGEVHIPVAQPSPIPQVQDGGNLQFNAQQGQDHLQGQGQGQPVQQMQQQQQQQPDQHAQQQAQQQHAQQQAAEQQAAQQQAQQKAAQEQAAQQQAQQKAAQDQAAQQQAAQQQAAQQKAAQDQAAQQQAAQQQAAQQQAAQQQAAQQQAAQQQAAQQQAAQQQAAQQQAAQQQAAQQQAAQQQAAQQQAAQQQAQQQAAQQQAQQQAAQPQAQAQPQH